MKDDRSQPELDLLVDLAKLLRKYGAETFERLRQRLESEGLLERLPEILGRVAHEPSLGRPVRAKSREASGISSEVKAIIRTFVGSDEGKADAIEEALAPVLPRRKASAKSLNNAARALGVVLPEITEGDEGLRRLIEELSKLDGPALRSRLDHLRDITSPVSGGTLEQWSDIILDSRRRAQQGGDEEPIGS